MFNSPLSSMKPNTMSGWTYEDFFPYEAYRKEQRDLMRYIEMDARLGKNILLLAPNGTGKTVIALSALLL